MSPFHCFENSIASLHVSHDPEIKYSVMIQRSNANSLIDFKTFLVFDTIHSWFNDRSRHVFLLVKKIENSYYNYQLKIKKIIYVRLMLNTKADTYSL